MVYQLIFLAWFTTAADAGRHAAESNVLAWTGLCAGSTRRDAAANGRTAAAPVRQ